MNDKEELKKLSEALKEAAEAIDNLIANDNEEREEELMAMIILKCVKLNKLTQ